MFGNYLIGDASDVEMAHFIFRAGSKEISERINYIQHICIYI